MKRIIAAFIFVITAISLSMVCFASENGMVLIDAQSRRVLCEDGKDKKLSMASTTKIMTALIALEETGLDRTFIVDKNAIKVEGSSMGLVEDDMVSLRILASGMLLASGNDAANAAAVKISGSVTEFVKKMNARAKELGMENTSFETPSGLDGEKHYSTAYDMAILGAKALENPDFAAICSQKNMKLQYGNPPYDRWLSNHNRLLKTFDGANGIKTGFTKKAGRCLVSSAERDGKKLICVTLNYSDDWDFHQNIYNEYFDKLILINLESMVETVEIPVCGGKNENVFAKALPVNACLFDGEKEKLKISIIKEPFIFAPIEKGDIVGKVKFYSGNDFVAETPLVAQNSVSVKDNKNIFQKIKDSLTVGRENERYKDTESDS